ncbi:DUF6479 family protein [Streptomyces sp. NPDC048484]|uniref:DUF6479 family protein n=1 Tax=Streptomyces sp. NPDC048484 TaxID=3155146 RepID=UPI003415B92F
MNGASPTRYPRVIGCPPHDLGDGSSHRATDQDPPTWGENSSGGFGSGGPGRA